jgi:ComF family protein
VRLGVFPRDALDVWLDALFPPRCAGCDRTGAHFCTACAASVKPIRPPWCASCGRTVDGLRAGGHTTASARAPLDGGQTTSSARAPLCLDCRSRPLPLAAVRSAGAFEGPLRKAIHRLKYRGRRGAARSLGDLLLAPAQALRTSWPADGASVLIVPVPLHPRRARERGYNQAALLAAPLASALGWRLDAGALQRVKDTPPLVHLSEVQRATTITGAFAATRRLEDEHVLLVDDVATTCSTLAAAARACLAAGAADVAAITLAREQ